MNPLFTGKTYDLDQLTEVYENYKEDVVFQIPPVKFGNVMFGYNIKDQSVVAYSKGIFTHIHGAEHLLKFYVYDSHLDNTTCTFNVFIHLDFESLQDIYNLDETQDFLKTLEA